MKFVVTGGAGFIGSHIVDLLVLEGETVHIVDNFSTGKRSRVNRKAILHEVNILDSKKLVNIFKGSFGIFHTAADPRMLYSLKEPKITHDVNATGTLNVLLAARDAGVSKVVYSSSSAVYGNANSMPLDEGTNSLPVIPYAIQKRVGEDYCRMMRVFYNLDTVSLRYFNVYGPRQNTSVNGSYATVIGIFLKQKKEGRPLTIVSDGKQRRDFVHVMDVARANLLAMKSKKVGKGEVINIGSGQSYSVLEIARTIGGPKVFVEPRPWDVKDSLADISGAKKLINWSPEITLENGVRDLMRE